jgi:hypothetical protein
MRGKRQFRRNHEGNGSRDGYQIDLPLSVLIRSIITHYRSRLPEVHPDAIITRLFQPLSLMPQGLFCFKEPV